MSWPGIFGSCRVPIRRAMRTPSLRPPPPEDFAVVIGGKAVGGIGLAPGTDVGRFNAGIGCRTGASYRGFVPGLRTGVSYRGRGVMTAAVARAAEWVFANTPIIRIFAAAYVSNPASQRVLDKAGFRFVGTMHRAFVGNGAFVDGCYYELLK
nr:GNAT family protein [Alistipes finegoldii]